MLWASPSPLTPREVLDRLKIDPAVSYSTVLTILRRLWKKELVSRQPDGKAYRYSPVVSREEHVAATMAAALDAAVDPSAALGHFVANLSVEDTTSLKRLLGKK